MQVLNPALLWGLALVAAPIVIHLLNRRRFRVVRWAAMDFLLQANRQNRRRVRIEHLLVLLLRCLALALIALAVARPLSSRAGLALLPGAGEAVERIVVLDDSASMSHRDGRRTSFERAREAVATLIADVQRERSRDYLSVYRASEGGRADLLRAAPGDERATAFLERLSDDVVGGGGGGGERIEVTDGGFTPDAVLARALAREPDDPRRVAVYVVTDLRRRDWIGATGAQARRIGDALRAALEGDAARGVEVSLLVVDVGAPGRANLGITDVRPLERLALAGVPVELEIRVRNDGAATARGVPLSLETAAGRVPLPPIAEIAPGAEVTVRQRTTFLAGGSQALTLRLPEDELPADDARHLALRVRERLRVLVVEGEPGAGPLEGEADLLRLALAPSGDVLTGVEPVVVRPERLDDEDLDDVAAVVLCNVPAWPRERLARLERFVREGGGLAVFLGDRVDATRYDDELYRGGDGLLPCALGERVEAADEQSAPRLAAPELEHTLTRVFEGERNPFLRRVRARVRRTLPLDPVRDRDVQVLLRLDDPARTPFVVEAGYGRGRVVLLNTTADAEWSTWPRDPSYPVTAQELVRLLAPAASEGLNLRTGEPLSRALDPVRFRSDARLAVPGEEVARTLHAEPRADSAALWVRFERTRSTGLYELRLQPREPGQPVEREVLAVNLEAGEGELARSDGERLRQALAPLPDGVRFDVVRPDGDGDGALLARSDGERNELWRLCLLLAIGALALEQLLAWRAARHQDGYRAGASPALQRAPQLAPAKSASAGPGQRS